MRPEPNSPDIETVFVEPESGGRNLFREFGSRQDKPDVRREFFRVRVLPIKELREPIACTEFFSNTFEVSLVSLNGFRVSGAMKIWKDRESWILN